MRDSLLLVCVTFLIEGYFTGLTVVGAVDSSSDSNINCVDGHGERFAAGQAVPSAHPCRTCFCGTKGNILCDSLNRITECQPPASPLCKLVNGTTCCERSFTCERLKECSFGGAFYQPGEVARHSNEQCQTCTCGFDGRIDCIPHNNCGKPQWISDLGATECTPVYAGKNCCPTDYNCKCTVFNETLSRGPRNVARCNTCSCSKLGGVSTCKPMACKVPYKFSDKCKAIYRGTDCCPIDYDCGSTGRSSRHKQHETSHTPKSSQTRTEIYDVLPYAPEVWTTQKTTEKIIPTENFQKFLASPAEGGQKKLRAIPTSVQNHTDGLRVIIKDIPDASKVVVVVDGMLNGPIVTTSSPEVKTPAMTTQLTTHDALLKVFMKQAEKVSKITKVTELNEITSTTETGYASNDFIAPGAFSPYSTHTPKSLKGKNRMDAKAPPLRTQSNNPGGMHRNSLESNLTTPGTIDRVSSSTAFLNDLQTKQIAMADDDVVSTSASHSTLTTLGPLISSVTSINSDSSTTNKKITTSGVSPESENVVITGTTKKYLPSTTTKKPTTVFNASRFNLDNQYSMSSADAGFLADDLSYKLFSVNFFRSPVKEIPTTPPVIKNFLTPGPAVAWETLNFSDVSLSDSLAQQGQKDRFQSYNLTTFNATMNASVEAQLDLLAEANFTSTIPPDYQVVTFGNRPRNHRPKSAGQLLPPALGPGLGGPNTPILPFTTEIEFKGFGMEPEIEIKPLKGLAGAAAMAGMLNRLAGGGGGGGGGGGLNVGGQLAGVGSANNANNAGGGNSLVAMGGGGGNAGSKLAAAAAAQDAMEELAEGGTGDGALALAAALMHNPHRPMAARLFENTKVGRITTLAPTVAVAFPNGSMQISAALKEHAPNPGTDAKKAAALEGVNPGARRIGEFNSFFPSQNHNFNQFNGMGNPWSSPIFTGSGMSGGSATTTDKTASTPAFPFEMVADVIEEGRGPALTQLLGALQMMGGRQQGGMGGMGGMPSFPMGPPPRGSMAGMNAMMNAMNPMMNRNNFFNSFPQQSAGTGMEGMFGAGGLFNLFAGSLSALESTAPASEPTLIAPASASRSSAPAGQQTLVEPKRLAGPAYNTAGENGGQMRPMYKVSSGLTESPLVQNPRPSALE